MDRKLSRLERICDTPSPYSTPPHIHIYPYAYKFYWTDDAVDMISLWPDRQKQIHSKREERERVNEISVESAEQTSVFVSIYCLMATPIFLLLRGRDQESFFFFYIFLLWLHDERRFSACVRNCTFFSLFYPDAFPPQIKTSPSDIYSETAGRHGTS